MDFGSIRDRLKVTAATLVEVLTRGGRREYYSQFGEDAVIQRYFDARIKAGQRGFYVDVGAFAPMTFSNTYWLYRHGWRGLNIDATPGSMRAFRWLRRRDVNVECAVSTTEGILTFYQLGIRTVLNTLSESVATAWEQQLGRKATRVRVPAKRLETILAEHVPPDGRVDLLSVDVEGMDLDVLQSNDWGRFRPELVVVEDHRSSFSEVSNSPTTTFLAAQGYEIYAWVRPSVFFSRTTQPASARAFRSEAARAEHS